MELKEMTIEELEARGIELQDSIDSLETLEEVEARKADLEAIQEELENRKAIEAEKAEIRQAIADKEVPTEPIETIEPEERKLPTMEEIRNSKEYINAYADYIKTGSDAECRALLSENATGGTVAVPELVYDIVKTAWEREGITARVRKAYIKGNLKVGFEISGTDAVKHQEGVAVDEETLVLGTVELVPASIKKWISISDEALDLSGEAFLRYIYDELTYRIAKKAADEIIASIEACGTVSTTTCPSVPKITATACSIDLVAKAIGYLSDEAANPVVMMNKATWSEFKKAQYAASFPGDPFEGLPVEFNNTIKAFDAASTGDTFVIVGDLDHGALMNLPNGEEIGFKFDDMTLATSDLVRIIGRMFVAEGVVAPNAFVKITK